MTITDQLKWSDVDAAVKERKEFSRHMVTNEILICFFFFFEPFSFILQASLFLSFLPSSSFMMIKKKCYALFRLKIEMKVNGYMDERKKKKKSAPKSHYI